MSRPGPTLDLSPPVLSMRWLAVYRRNFRVWFKLLGPALLGNILEPLFYLLALGYGLGSFVGVMEGMDYLTFLASGFVCASVMNTATFEGLYSAYTRMAVQRTWEGMLVAPLNIEDVLVGEMVWAGTKSLISACLILFIAALLGAVQGWMTLVALPILFLLGITFGAMALVVTAVSPNYDFFMYYFTLLVTPMFLLSGVFFPLEQLPELLQNIARCLPLTHGVALVRPLVTGQILHDQVAHLLVLVGYIVVSGYLAVVLLRRRLLS